MILDNKITVVGNSKIISHYKSLGYDIVPGKSIVVETKDLTKGSHVEINVKCDVCNKIKKLSYEKYIRNTKNMTEPYCCCSECGLDKYKKTNFEKYGQSNPAKNEFVKEKKERTNFEKYGCKCVIQNEIINEKAKTTMIKKYGVEHALQNIKIKEKYKNTCLENFGFENAMQNQEVFDRNQISGFKLKSHEPTGLKYRGKNELHFLDYCFNNNINIEKPPSIKYEFENKNRVYHPDFYLKEKNLIIEIKSNYYYNKYINKNLTKQEACISQGYDFIFIIDKIYDEFSL